MVVENLPHHIVAKLLPEVTKRCSANSKVAEAKKLLTVENGETDAEEK